jgi:hypothetical protein
VSSESFDCVEKNLDLGHYRSLLLRQDTKVCIQCFDGLANEGYVLNERATTRHRAKATNERSKVIPTVVVSSRRGLLENSVRGYIGASTCVSRRSRSAELLLLERGSQIGSCIQRELIEPENGLKKILKLLAVV